MSRVRSYLKLGNKRLISLICSQKTPGKIRKETIFCIIVFYYLFQHMASLPCGEATAWQGKLMAAHMKFFLRCGGRSYRFSVINAFAEMNELNHN